MSLVRKGVGVVAVAVSAAAFALVFRRAVEAVFRYGYRARDVLAAFEALPWPARLLVPAGGACVAGGLNALASRVAGAQGVGDVMEAVVLGKRRISLRVAALKAVGSWAAMVSGGSIGREGPIIQLGGGLGGAVARRLGLAGTDARALIAAGTASGFAAAYNTPLAAVLFVVEVVTGVIALDVILPVLVAAPVATAVMRSFVGSGPVYVAHVFPPSSSTDLIAYGLLGCLAGIAGPAFMALLARSERWARAVRAPKPLLAAFGGLCVGTIAVWLPEVTGNGYEAINLILAGGVATSLVVLLFFAKAFATAASVSTGSPGGVFTPAMFLGASLGGAFGRLAAIAGADSPAVTVGSYALVGMAAMTAATTHAPVLAAVMVFELSGQYSIVLPLLVATALATLVSRRLRPSSIYMEELERRGIGWEMTLAGRRLYAPASSEERG
jgi:CIC family chloride channel protein